MKNVLIEFDESIESIFDTKTLITSFQNKAYNIKQALLISENDLEKSELLSKLEKIKELIVNLKDLDTINFHKNIAEAQRIAYNKHTSNVNELKNKILIEVDFKQRIVVGMSPRQVNSEYYSQISRSCLGKRKKNNFEFKLNFKKFSRFWHLFCY